MPRLALAALLLLLAAPARAAPPASAPAPAGPPSDDVVETIEGVPDAAPASVPAPRPAPPARGLTPTLSGWSRASFEAGLQRAGWHHDAPSAADVPYDQVVGRLQGYLRLRVAEERRFEAVVSGLVGVGLFEQDADKSQSFLLFNGRSLDSKLEASLREAYVGWFWRRLDLRIGQQRVAWGRGDAFTPNDVLNAHDLRDPILAEPEALHIPTLMARATLDAGPVLIEGVFVPFFTPDQFSVYGRNWSLVQPDAPLAYRQLLSTVAHATDPSMRGAVDPLLGQTALPRDDLRGAQAALRVARSAGSVDLDAYYHFGYDRRPNLQIDPTVAQLLATTDLSAGHLADLTPILQAMDAGVHPFSATYVRRHHVGASAQAALGVWTLRADVAYDSQTVAVRKDDLTGVLTPAFQAVGGAEYHTGEHGNSIILEGYYQHLVSPPPDGQLLGANRDSGGFAANWRWTFLERLEVELRFIAGLNPMSFSARPQIGWKWGAFTLRAGVLVLDGEVGSLPHYYRLNRMAYLVARYAY